MPFKQFLFCVFTIFICVVLFSSCEKEVHINLNAGDPQLVVDGAIETGIPPYVILTKSIGYLSTVNLETLENSFVHGAVVKVSDGNKIITLKEYSIDTGINSNKFSFYSIDTSDPIANNFRGQVEHSYTLNISYEGKNYQAVTKIPTPKPADSFWIKKPSDVTLAKIPLGRLIYFRYKDPDTVGNYLRIYTKRNNEPYYPGLNSVYNDEIVNGTIITTNIDLGYDRSRIPEFDSIGLAFLHDTITIKWCAIDRGVYKFWDTYEYAQRSTGSPFASPINLKTNLTGGALGVWAGYGTHFTTLIVKD